MQAIVSTTSNWCLGDGATVPWFDAEESKRFRSLTLGGTIVMGRKTYEARLPWMRGARKVVLSRNRDLLLPDAMVMNTITEIVDSCPDGWVVGGPMTFSAFLPHVRYMFLTKFPIEAQGQHWLPDISWSLWLTRGQTGSYGRELMTLERRTLARTQTKQDASATTPKRKDEAKKA